MKQLKTRSCFWHFGTLIVLMLMSSTLYAEKLSFQQMQKDVIPYYFYWKGKYLIPSTRFPGDWKVDFDGRGTTVSEAIGYGMLITVCMADADPAARACFDGLDRFRRHFPSNINPIFMCWKIPKNEKPTADDCATDGELDMAYALLAAYQRWKEPSYLREAKELIGNIATSLVRSDYSLRMGDWNSEEGQTRPSDFMPAHFRAFRSATSDPIWSKVEDRCYATLKGLQSAFAPGTGLVPDFAIKKDGCWVPAKPGFLESRHDGDYYYNACRVPWRIGWAFEATGDVRARSIVEHFMRWMTTKVATPDRLAAGYRLDGTPLGNSGFDTACFISPTGVAAMACDNRLWESEAFQYALRSRESYYEDTLNLLCMIGMSGRQK